jgi:hypothetical protein
MRLAPRLLLLLALSSSLLCAARNPLEGMLRSLDPRAMEKQRKDLESSVARNPTESSAWMELAQFSYQNDEPEKTLEILAKAIAAVPRPAVFWRFTAQVHLDDANSGPTGLQRPGVYRNRKSPSTLDEQSFRRLKLQSALEALDRCIALESEFTEESSRRRVHVLMGLERWAEAEAQATILLKTKWNGEDAALQAFSVLKQNRKDDCKALLKAGLEKDTRCGDLHAVLARLHESLGETQEAAREVAVCEFYKHLMPDSKLLYSERAAASMAKLLGKKEGTSGMFGGDRLNDQIKAEIESLAARQDEESSELLATLAASHFAHGELENRAFAILGERKDEGRIRRILSNARSNCTVAGCLNQMIPLKMEGTFELLRDMLERDGGMFPMRIVAKMERLGDPRAGLVLRDYSNNKEAAFFQEALVALGSFDSPETRAHLQKWQKDKEAGPYAATGLYRITADPKLLKVISKALAKMDTWEAMAITNALEENRTPEVVKIMKTFGERVAREEAARKAREDKK